SMLDLATSLIKNSEEAQQIHSLLDNIKPSDPDWNWDFKRAQRIRLELISKMEGDEKATQFLEQNIANSDFRKKTIETALSKKDYKKAISFLYKNIQLAILLANTPNIDFDLRKIIIENLPNDKEIQKDKLLLLLNFDEQHIDEAFKIIQDIDLSKITYLECRPILQITQQMEAWDFEVIIINKLLENEKDEKYKFYLQWRLFCAYLNLDRYQEVIEIGKRLLEKDLNKYQLTPLNKEALLTNTIIACIERGKIDQKSYLLAKDLLCNYPLENPSYEFKIGVEAELYLLNDDVEKALQSVIEGVKIKKILSRLDYANLNFLLGIKIGNKCDISLEPLEKVGNNSFIKFKNIDQWYFIGKNDELDALQISEENKKYSALIGKKCGEIISIESRYTSKKQENEIELIYSIEKYILWQSVQNFQTLSKDGDLPGVQLIEIPQKEDSIDLQNLITMFEDINKPKNPLFEFYCKGNVSLAMLALTEGGLTNAIGRINEEKRGYINFSTGDSEEFEKQKETANNIIIEQQSFYIDSTSALLLSETGILLEILSFLPNLKIPSSVINFLANTAEKYLIKSDKSDRMKYSKGKLSITTFSKDEFNQIHSNFIKSIKALELNKNNIGFISPANKIDCFSEKKISAELCDACILAQKENIPILTEDYLYLKTNELETSKKAPEYFSSLALLRVLIDKERISFSKYLDYFNYLSSHRFRFLSISSIDLEKAVFGDGNINIAKPENIRNFNFPFTLAEGYGVTFNSSFTVIGTFVIKVLIDNTITEEITEKIFFEILQSFPTKMPKKEFGYLLLRECIKEIEKNDSKYIFHPKNSIMYKKI
ncbi:MAG: hypothetical protein Q7U04_01175, partial [Bacteriovorax sp.]|nr:hypothetical protein [Bacteriovorax sp.]